MNTSPLVTLDLGYNMLTASDPALIAWLNSNDPDWAQTQTVPPTNVQAFPQSTTSIQVTWTPILYTGDGGYYEISFATSPGGPFTVHGTTANKSATGYLVTGLSPATTYCFRVRTFTPVHDFQQNDLWSDYSEVVCETTLSSVVADFTGSPTSGTAPLTVNFTDQSTGNITSWSWTFGDGDTSTQQNPSHTYNTAGDFTVSLTVSGPGGSDTRTRTNYITVSPFVSCLTSTATWQNTPLPTQNGAFTVEFDATPNGNNIDALTALSQGPGNTFSDFAAIVRFYTNGRIEARNGSVYEADVTINYTANTTYHFQLDINVPAGTYSVYVDTPSQDNILLANQYAFRTEQSGVTTLDNWGIWAGVGSHQVCNFAITNPPTGEVSVVGAWTADGNWIPKSTFAPGEPIQWVIDVENTTGSDADIELTYDVQGPNGEQVIYWNGVVTTPPGIVSWGLPGTVSGGLNGTHTFSAFGLYQTISSQAATTYLVQEPPPPQ